MATAFDPTRFIQAENERFSQSLAAPEDALASDLAKLAGDATPLETAEISGFWTDPEPKLATLATLAAPPPSNRDIRYPWDADLYRFVDAPCPVEVRPDKWDEITGEVHGIRERWADQAIDLGWSSHDLFGGPPNPFARRVDLNGLARSIVGLLTPVRIDEITASFATLLVFNGQRMKYYRRHRPGAVHIWEAYAMAGGP